MFIEESERIGHCYVQDLKDLGEYNAARILAQRIAALVRRYLVPQLTTRESLKTWAEKWDLPILGGRDTGRFEELVALVDGLVQGGQPDKYLSSLLQIRALTEDRKRLVKMGPQAWIAVQNIVDKALEEKK
jgi:hypothetical protein